MKVSVVGTGKLGGPLAVLLAQYFPTVAVDLDPGIIEKWDSGVAPFNEPELQIRLSSHEPVFTTDFSKVFDTDITFIIVPTPSNKIGAFTSEFVLDAITRVGKVIRKKETKHTVVIVSTVMPGETYGPILKQLESASGKIVGDMLGLAYSPEFVALGNVFQGMERPDMILIGEADEHSGDVLVEVMSYVVKNNAPVVRMSTIDAEITKISVNAYITMKSCFANNLAEVCERIFGADATKVTSAVGLDTRIGNKYFLPSVAVGGPCLPRDSLAFNVMAERLGVNADLAAASHRINERQTERLATRVRSLIKPGEPVGILGLAYKPGTYVTEASAGLDLAYELLRLDVDVIGFDPMARPPVVPLATSAAELIKDTSTIVVMTACEEFKDLEFPASKTVLDCWGVLNPKRVAGELLRLGVGV